MAFYQTIVISLFVLATTFTANSQILHDNTCSSISTNFTLDWDETPTSNQFNWSPNGSTSFTASNIQGSGNSISFSVTGATGTLASEGGKSTPSINTTLSGGADALHISSSGLSAAQEIKVTMTFSPALAGDISFDIYNIREQFISGDDPGQQVEIYGLTSGGYAIVPQLTDNGSPSWELEGPGVIDGNASSTTGTNDQVGVNFRSISDISTITVILRRCSSCDLAPNTEFAIGDIDVCLTPDTDQDGIADTQDEDDDNDGIYDVIEKCPSTSPVTAEWDDMNYNDGDVSNTYNLPDGTNMTVAVSSNGASIVAGETNNFLTGGEGSSTVGLFLNGNQNLQVNSIDVSFSWDQAIKDLSFTIFDVDQLGGQYVDSVTVIGFYNGFVVFPNMTGSANNTVTQNRGVGDVSTDDNLATANVDIAFTEPIDSMIIFYGNGATAPAAPGNQWITIWDLTYIGDCGSVDSDGDGIPDYLDIDADNDGIVDYIEWQGTTASPIAPAGSDADSDGIDDNFESIGSPVDTDGDGIPDFKDPDSDDDGDLDILEAYDTDNDGVINTSPSGVDTDGDGLDDSYDNQSGFNATTNITNNGQTTSDFPNLDENATPERDFREDGDIDDDGIQDYADIDDDNDGILDVDEGRGSNDPTGDEDGDGIPNWADNNDNGNGGDGTSSSYTDSNGDGIADIIEAGGVDTDGNGIVDGTFTDTDNDGWSNVFDSDNGGTALSNPDTDGDGYQNHVDIDSDDDGIVDIIESQPSGALITPSGTDTDGDGIDNNFDTDEGNSLTDPENTDGTDNPDYADANADNDVDSDQLEAYDTDNDGTANTTASGSDSDEDGLDDNFDNVAGQNTTTNITNNGQTSASFPDLDLPGGEPDWRDINNPNDNDGDGVANDDDIDDDNDGILDIDEGEQVVNDNTPGTGSYTVPNDGQYIITIKGAGGGGGSTTQGGEGATVTGTFDLTAGDIIRYVVGEGSTSGSISAGGGGSTGLFINSTIVMIAGGGAGGDNSSGAVGLGANTTIAGDNGTGGSAGSGGGAGAGGTAGGSDAGAGGGYSSAGANGAAAGGGQGADTNPDDGVTFVSGGSSDGANNSSGGGGFTGGGGAAGNAYSGGGGGASGGGAAGSGGSAGGGGSYLNTGATGYVSGTLTAGADGAASGGAGVDGADGFVEIVGFGDTDQDGVQDSYDPDSDGDGIADIIEAGGVDADGNGVVDGVFADTDGDGWSNVFDSDNGGTALTDADTDGDGLENRIDIDSDDDGIVDIIESQPSGTLISPSGTDSDGDGIDDSFDTDEGNTLTTPENTDGTDNPDYLDTNSDNDDENDDIEGWDLNNDGVADVTAAGSDADNDGLDDNYDAISGLNNTTNVTNGGQTSSSFPDLDRSSTPERDWREDKDNDGDGIDDSVDIDDDNDGILDTDENSCADLLTETISYEFYDQVPSGNTVDNIPYTGALSTGSVSSFDVNALQAAVDPGDGDTYSVRFKGYISISTSETYTFYTSSDDGSKLFISGAEIVDNDGLHGDVEASGSLALTPGIYSIEVLMFENTGGDVLTVSYSSASITKTQIPFTVLSEVGDCDVDNDGTPDRFDLDSDGDGIADIIEAGGVDADGNGIVDGVFADTDGDGWSNTFDSDNGGTALSDPDTDGDGLANRIDIDADDDGIVDIIESQASGTLISPSGTDSDGDGIDDNFDTDEGNSLTSPQNSDGTDNPDYIDTNSDNDIHSDLIEAWDLDNDGVADTNPAGTDADGDGLDDNFDNVSGLNSTTNITNGGQTSGSFPNLDNGDTEERDWREIEDYDNDGIADQFDLDKDNDGILDWVECGAGEFTISGGDGGSTTNFSMDDVNWAYFDFDDIDNSLSIIVNGGNLKTNNILQFEGSAGAGETFMEFVSDGAAMSTPWVSNSNGLPRFRVVIDETGVISIFGTRTTSSTVMEQMQARDASSFNSISFVVGSNSFSVVNQNQTGLDGISGTAYLFADCDKDGDGVPNYYDLDTDNDGIADIVEAGGVDADGDGMADDATDTDGDGYADLFDTNNGGTALAVDDYDGDGIPNYMDLDSDNDGIIDNVEAQTTAGYTTADNSDPDGDGWDAAYDSDDGGTAIVLSNHDGTGNPDYLDDDSDGDGLSDWTEGFDDNNDEDALIDLMTRADNFELVAGSPFYYINGDDSDSDGIPNWLEDDDLDGYPNFLDPDNALYQDTDNDGLIDLYDSDNGGTASVTPDGDIDGEYDFRDTDNQISLPVELLSFNAEKELDRVKLSWTTLTEVNNDYFTIERSTDGKYFEEIVRKRGAGNSTDRITYVAYDMRPLPGYNYYRLRQTDFDGKFKTFEIRKVYFESDEVEAAITIYPNPNNGDQLFMEMDQPQGGKYVYRILDETHQLIREDQFVIEVDVLYYEKEVLKGLQLAKGLYYLEVQGKFNTHVFKFLVQ
jgi:hypothetical protein